MIYHLFWLDVFWGIFPFFHGLTCVILLTLSESTMKQTDVSNWASAWPLMVIENQHMVFVSLVFNPKKFCYIKENNFLIQSCQRFEHLEVQQLLMITFEYTERFHLSFWLNCIWFSKFEWAWLESFPFPQNWGIIAKLNLASGWKIPPPFLYAISVKNDIKGKG